MTDSQVLKRLEFPAYCVRVLDNGLIAIAGGGGTAKTGVSNCIELGIIDYSNENLPDILSASNFNRAQFHSINKFEPNDAIMKFTSFSHDRCYSSIKKQNQAKLKTSKNGYSVATKTSQTSTNINNIKYEYDSSKDDLFLAAAVNDSIEIYKIQPTIDKLNKSNLRQRNSSTRRSTNSISNQQQLKPNGINHSNNNHNSQVLSTESNNLKASACLKLINSVKLSQSKDKPVNDDVFEDTESNTNNNVKKTLIRKTSSLRLDEESIETLAVCNMIASATNNESTNDILLCAGTSKGNIVIWNLNIDNLNDSNNNDNLISHSNTDIKTSKVKTFTNAHGKYDIDELQVNHNYFHLLSIGKDNRCFVWSLKKLNKLSEIDYLSLFSGNSNVRMKHARFANNGKTLYTTYIPRIRGGKKNLNSYIQRWECSDGHDTLNYKPTAKHCIKNTILTSVQASKDGNVICCGDYEGRIYLFDSKFSTLINFRRQHSSVVTDLAFYHDTTSSIFNSNNKLILSLSIDRTLQCYTYLDTDNTFNNNQSIRSPIRMLNQFSLCSMNTFKLVFILISLFFLFCYYFTHLE